MSEPDPPIESLLLLLLEQATRELSASMDAKSEDDAAKRHHAYRALMDAIHAIEESTGTLTPPRRKP